MGFSKLGQVLYDLKDRVVAYYRAVQASHSQYFLCLIIGSDIDDSWQELSFGFFQEKVVDRR